MLQTKKSAPETHHSVGSPQEVEVDSELFKMDEYEEITIDELNREDDTLKKVPEVCLMNPKLVSRRCAVMDCINGYDKILIRNSSGMFGFPVHKNNICKQWIMFCNNDTLLSLKKHHLSQRRICGLHFTKDSFQNVMRKGLKENAVPIKAVPIISKFPDDSNPSATILSKAANYKRPGTGTNHIIEEICSYAGCCSKTSDPSLRFFSFPVHNRKLCEEWALNCGDSNLFNLKGKLERMLGRRKVCEKHFHKDSLEIMFVKVLVEDAIPSIRVTKYLHREKPVVSNDYLVKSVQESQSAEIGSSTKDYVVGLFEDGECSLMDNNSQESYITGTSTTEERLENRMSDDDSLSQDCSWALFEDAPSNLEHSCWENQSTPKIKAPIKKYVRSAQKRQHPVHGGKKNNIDGKPEKITKVSLMRPKNYGKALDVLVHENTEAKTVNATATLPRQKKPLLCLDETGKKGENPSKFNETITSSASKSKGVEETVNLLLSEGKNAQAAAGIDKSTPSPKVKIFLCVNKKKIINKKLVKFIKTDTSANLPFRDGEVLELGKLCNRIFNKSQPKPMPSQCPGETRVLCSVETKNEGEKQIIFPETDTSPVSKAHRNSENLNLSLQEKSGHSSVSKAHRNSENLNLPLQEKSGHSSVSKAHSNSENLNLPLHEKYVHSSVSKPHRNSGNLNLPLHEKYGHSSVSKPHRISENLDLSLHDESGQSSVTIPHINTKNLNLSLHEESGQCDAQDKVVALPALSPPQREDYENSVDLTPEGIPIKNQNLHSCFYCNKITDKINEHLIEKHSSEEEVNTLYSLNNKAEIKDILFLSGIGDFKHNCRVLDTGDGFIISEGGVLHDIRTIKKNSFLCCLECAIFVHSHNFIDHQKKCLFRSATQILPVERSSFVESEAMLMYLNKNQLNKKIHAKYIDRLKSKFGLVAKHDELILLLISYQYCRNQYKDYSLILVVLQRLGFLLMVFRAIVNDQNIHFHQILSLESIDNLFIALDSFFQEINEADKPAVYKSLYSYISLSAIIWRGKCLIDGDLKSAKKALEFYYQFSPKYKKEISTQLIKKNIEDSCIKSQDSIFVFAVKIVDFKDSLRERIVELTDELCNSESLQGAAQRNKWLDLADVTMALICLTNPVQFSAVDGIKLIDYASRPDNTLDDLSDYQSMTFPYFKFSRKHIFIKTEYLNSDVVIALSATLKKAFDTLITRRPMIGDFQKSPRIFLGFNDNNLSSMNSFYKLCIGKTEIFSQSLLVDIRKRRRVSHFINISEMSICERKQLKDYLESSTRQKYGLCILPEDCFKYEIEVEILESLCAYEDTQI